MYDESKEIREAVISGEKALVSLKDAKRYLECGGYLRRRSFFRADEAFKH